MQSLKSPIQTKGWENGVVASLNVLDEALNSFNYSLYLWFMCSEDNRGGRVGAVCAQGLV